MIFSFLRYLLKRFDLFSARCLGTMPVSLRRRSRKVRPFFDEPWYRREYSSDRGAVRNPLAHYLACGWKRGNQPHRHFDVHWYLSTYRDVASSGAEPFEHFLVYGWREGRAPNAEVAKDPSLRAHDLSAMFPVPGGGEGGSRSRGQAHELMNRVAALKRVSQYKPQTPRTKLRPPRPDRLRIAWVIPDFQKGAGGHMNIFRMSHYLEQFGHEVEIFIQHPSHHRTGRDARKTINDHFIPFSGRVELFSTTAPRSEGDALIATDRYTCFPVDAMSGFHRKFYFVQDLETLFYPAGSEALLSEQTYAMDFDCLCNGEWLERIMRERYGRWACAWWQAFDSRCYHPGDPAPDRGSAELPRIAFYARYVTPRRAVELGMIALEMLHQRGLRFHVDFFGWPLGDLDVPYSHRDHGIASPQALGDLYRKATIGMVFSATNHSLINKEMMACGLPVIDLDVESVRAIFPADALFAARPDPEGIATALAQLLTSPDRRRSIRERALRFVENRTWEQSARVVERALRERVGAEVALEESECAR